VKRPPSISPSENLLSDMPLLPLVIFLVEDACGRFTDCAALEDTIDGGSFREFKKEAAPGSFRGPKKDRASQAVHRRAKTVAAQTIGQRSSW